MAEPSGALGRIATTVRLHKLSTPCSSRSDECTVWKLTSVCLRSWKQLRRCRILNENTINIMGTLLGGTPWPWSQLNKKKYLGSIYQPGNPTKKTGSQWISGLIVEPNIFIYCLVTCDPLPNPLDFKMNTTSAELSMFTSSSLLNAASVCIVALSFLYCHQVFCPCILQPRSSI